MRPKVMQLYGFHVAALTNILLGILIWTIFHVPIYPYREWSIVHLPLFLAILAGSLFTIFLVDSFYSNKYRLTPNSALAFFKQKSFGWTTIFLSISTILSFETVITVHTTIKQFIPFINKHRYDAIFDSMEPILHFGTNFPLTLGSRHNFLWTNELFDWCYRSWFCVIPLAIGYFIYSDNRRKCDLFLTSFYYLYCIGILVGLFFPSFGPFYIYNKCFPADGMYFCNSLQIVLRTVSDGVSLEALKSGHVLFYGYGLMAMPSLHVSVCFLYVVFFWNEHRLLRSIALVYLVLIFIGSMMSGWHYSVDGYAAVPLVALSVFLARCTLKFTKYINAKWINPGLATSTQA